MSISSKPKLNDDQIKVVNAIIDTFIPELTGQELENFVSANSNKSNSEVLRAYGKSGIINEKLSESVVDKIHLLPPEKIKELGLVFKILSTRIGTLLLGGYYGDFPSLTREQRTRVVISWSNSMISKLRILSKSLMNLATLTYYTQSIDVMYKAIEYPGPDPEMHSNKFTSKEFPVYKFIEVPPQGLEISVDVVIVGSGAGAGIVAAELSKAGKRVLVVEKGHYFHQSELSLNQAESIKNLYENAGVVSSSDGAVTVFAGSTWGGGTTINWSASLQLPYNVREEWSKQGLPHFTSDAYQQSLDTIIQRLGISDKHLIHNKPNSILLEGCRRLGYPVKDVPQNTANQTHSCGWCGFGCRYGEKQGTLMSFLKDAMEHGAQFMQDTFIEKVLVDEGKAVGVVGHQNGHKVTIKANKVVVSAGSIHSPSLLHRSGLKNKNIGRNLAIHPCIFTFGKFDEQIEACKGSILTSAASVSENVDGHGYGAYIEVPTFHPLVYSTFARWDGAANHKSYMLDFNYVAPLIVIARDRDTGSVSTGPDGLPRINYSLSNHDIASLADGVERSIRILVAAGAKSIWTSQHGLDEFKVSAELGQNDPELTKFIQKCKNTGFYPGSTTVATAHQMGTCRMGSSPATSVIKPTGETWEVKDLYVSDASTFPTASGVNPMLTIFSISHHIAQFINKVDNDAATL